MCRQRTNKVHVEVSILTHEIFVDAGGGEESSSASQSDERRDGRVCDPDGEEQEIIGVVDRIVEGSWHRRFADVSRRASGEDRTEPDAGKREELREIDEGRGDFRQRNRQLRDLNQLRESQYDGEVPNRYSDACRYRVAMSVADEEPSVIICYFERD